MRICALHRNLLSDLHEPAAQSIRFQPRARTNRTEIGVILKQESLRFAPRAQRSVSPILHCHRNHGRPQPPFRNALFRCILLSMHRYLAPARSPWHVSPVMLSAAWLHFDLAATHSQKHLMGQSRSKANSHGRIVEWSESKGNGRHRQDKVNDSNENGRRSGTNQSLAAVSTQNTTQRGITKSLDYFAAGTAASISRNFDARVTKVKGFCSSTASLSRIP